MSLELVPGMITIAGLIVSLISMYLAGIGRWEASVRLFFLYLFFDYLDGFVARVLGATSKTGELLDRFVDRIAQCIAPALLYYLFSKGKLHALISSCLVVVGLIRLMMPKGKAFFRGLPLFVPAISIEASVFLGRPIPWLLLLVLVLLAILPVPYPRAKETALGEKGNWRTLVWETRPSIPLLASLSPSALAGWVMRALLISVLGFALVGPLVSRSKS